MVGFVDGNDEEEVLVAVFGEEGAGAVGGAMGVGKFRGDAVGGDGGGVVLQARGGALGGGEAFEVVAAVEPVARLPAGRAAAVAKVVGAVEVPFADVAAGEAGGREALAEGGAVDGGGEVVGDDAVGVGPAGR